MNRHKDFWKVTEDSLKKSMEAYNIEASMKNELLNLYKVLSPFKEVLETLKSLKEQGYKLAILSNGTPNLLNDLVKTNNLENFFDDIFSIEKLEFINQIQEFMISQLKNMVLKKTKLFF